MNLESDDLGVVCVCRVYGVGGRGREGGGLRTHIHTDTDTH